MGNLIHYNEASDYTFKIPDPMTRDLVAIAHCVLTKKILRGEMPEGDFDVMYFVKTLEETYSEHGVVAMILRGESISWPE